MRDEESEIQQTVKQKESELEEGFHDDRKAGGEEGGEYRALQSEPTHEILKVRHCVT